MNKRIVKLINENKTETPNGTYLTGAEAGCIAISDASGDKYLLGNGSGDGSGLTMLHTEVDGDNNKRALEMIDGFGKDWTGLESMELENDALMLVEDCGDTEEGNIAAFVPAGLYLKGVADEYDEDVNWRVLLVRLDPALAGYAEVLAEVNKLKDPNAVFPIKVRPAGRGSEFGWDVEEE